MIVIEFERNELEKALFAAHILLYEKKIKVPDCVVSEKYADGFGAWRVTQPLMMQRVFGHSRFF